MTTTAAEFDDAHRGYGEPISVNDADGRIYEQETCRCGMPLGMHLSLEAHRAQELEQYVQVRNAEAAGHNHTAVLTRVLAQIADLDREMNAFDSIPIHIHAILDQIGTEGAIDAGLPYPREDAAAAFA
ncbi:hypothetical protein [Arthrobacter sp. UYCo732]|uniref:hypothetical protein n=1 Tax=Arthrobacter sp. UYCo732 TaxID=3156336 RepID=UPI00339B018D